jgi:hypothetical protein
MNPISENSESPVLVEPKMKFTSLPRSIKYIVTKKERKPLEYKLFDPLKPKQIKTKNPLMTTMTNINMNPNSTLSSLANLMDKPAPMKLILSITNSNPNRSSGLFSRNEDSRRMSLTKLGNTFEKSASNIVNSRLQRRSSLGDTTGITIEAKKNISASINTTIGYGENLTGFCGQNFGRW